MVTNNINDVWEAIKPQPADWDGMGAAEVTQETSDRARRFVPIALARHGPCDTASGTPAGSIVVAWQTTTEYRECEIQPGWPAQWMTVDNVTGKAEHWPEDIPGDPDWGHRQTSV